MLGALLLTDLKSIDHPLRWCKIKLHKVFYRLKGRSAEKCIVACFQSEASPGNSHINMLFRPCQNAPWGKNEKSTLPNTYIGLMNALSMHDKNLSVAHSLDVSKIAFLRVLRATRLLTGCLFVLDTLGCNSLKNMERLTRAFLVTQCLIV